MAHPAALADPNQEVREQGLRALRLELEHQTDPGLVALLEFEVARLHELRDDLASAARDSLSATKHAAGFVEPLEGLVDIAIRSRSRGNLEKLLERLSKLAKTESESVRAGLTLALTHLGGDDVAAAIAVLESALEKSPPNAALWLVLESCASRLGDPALLLKAVTGRAAHARSVEMRCLLLERMARLQVEHGEKAAALDSLRQSVDELPSFRALNAWEELAHNARDLPEASRAALQTATIIRAGLEEPEEAELYQIPHAELRSERAVAAQVRAVVASLGANDFDEARGLAQQLTEFSPQHPLGAALLLELCHRAGDTSAVFDASERLRQVAPSVDGFSPIDRAALLVLSAISAERAHRPDDAQRALGELQVLAPRSLLVGSRKWREAAGDPSRLADLLATWLEEKGELASGSEVALALLTFALGDDARCRAVLEGLFNSAPSAAPAGTSNRRSSIPPDGDGAAAVSAVSSSAHSNSGAKDDSSTDDGLLVSVARALAIAEESLRAFPAGRSAADAEIRASGSERSALLSSLLEEVATPEDRRALLWDRAREALGTGRADGLVAPNDMLDPWANLLLVLLHPKTESGGNPTLSNAVSRFQAESFPAADLSFSLDALLAATGSLETVSRHFQARPDDPFWAGAYLEVQRRARAAGLSDARFRSAAALADGSLKGGWLLKCAFDCLATGELDRALELLDGAKDFAPRAAETLQKWFRVRRAAGDPHALLDALKDAEPGDAETENERALFHAALLYRLSPDRFLAEAPNSPSPALGLLRALVLSSQAPDYLDQHVPSRDELRNLPLLTEAQKAQLVLASKIPVDRGDLLFARSREWLRTESSPTTLLLHWVSATRTNQSEARTSCLAQLGSTLGSREIVAAVPLSDLGDDERNHHVAQLNELARTQSVSGSLPEDGPARALARRASVLANYALLEHQEDESTPDWANRLFDFAEGFDVTLKEADAQNAALLSAFHRLTHGDHLGALVIFERLFAVLPDDLTCARGLQFAAQKVGRSDLEAPALRTLARAEDDGSKAADYWERAGLLFEDVLEKPDEAEECYTAALTRRPGSRVAFERAYRFARLRKDRPKQVELLDARIDTADTETLLIELYWEKARYCRMLGRRQVALRALTDLLALSPGHLPSLALSAELYLVDGQLEPAADLLSEIARHPDTPDGERKSTGLFACDLFERQKRHRDSVELLQFLDERSLTGSAGLERRARSLARSEDWGEAYKAFSELSQQQDSIEARLVSARMMLAIQRDHLRDPEEMKFAARSVLRDAPTDADAVQMVLLQNFPREERRRLLASARQDVRASLRKMPLDPAGIDHFASLCADCGDDRLERISLGIASLVGQPNSERSARLEELRSGALPLPSAPFGRADIEAIADPLQLGSAGKYLSLVAPYLVNELDPSLEALGISSLMRMDEFSGTAERAEVGIWMGAFGDSDFELYVGGHEGSAIRGIHGDLATIVIGKDIGFPLNSVDRARVVVQLFALHFGAVTLTNHPAEDLEKWLRATEILAGGLASEGDQEVDEMARALGKNIPRVVRDEMSKLYFELTRAQVPLAKSVYAVQRGAARVAVLVHGEPSILRDLPELLPRDPEMLDVLMADVVRFCLSDQFEALRRKAGLEGA